ncbi:MAG: hypothetical protein IPP90_08750 [Gemmatimonadaceae bacterium]|nr:hypothetical protein [Gemmatimonadaceae bacterium]
MLSKRVFAVGLLLVAAGCARRPQPDDSVSSNTASRGSDVITARELSDPSVSGGDALEAVRRLRPRFLATRGAGSIRIASAGTVHISVHGGPLLNLSELSRMRPSEIAEIRYLNATDATQRFGTLAGSGAVLLVRIR